MDIQKLSIEKLNPSAYNPRKDLKPVMLNMKSYAAPLRSSVMLSLSYGINARAILSVAINGTRYWWHSDIPLWIAWCWTSMSKRKKP